MEYESKKAAREMRRKYEDRMEESERTRKRGFESEMENMREKYEGRIEQLRRSHAATTEMLNKALQLVP